jgi:hypothetical protein
MKRSHILNRQLALLGALVLQHAVLLAAAPAAERGAFKVRDFGAVGDGKALDSPAIDRAIAAWSTWGIARQFAIGHWLFAISPAAVAFCGMRRSAQISNRSAESNDDMAAVVLP